MSSLPPLLRRTDKIQVFRLPHTGKQITSRTRSLLSQCKSHIRSNSQRSTLNHHRKFHTDITFPLDEITWTGTIPTTLMVTPTCTTHMNGISIQHLPSLRPVTFSTQHVKSTGSYVGLDEDPLGYLWVPLLGAVPYNQNWLALFYPDIDALQNGTCPFPSCAPTPSVPADGDSGAALFLTVTSTGTENGRGQTSAVSTAVPASESSPQVSQPASSAPIFTPVPTSTPTQSPTTTILLSISPALQSQTAVSSPNSVPGGPAAPLMSIIGNSSPQAKSPVAKSISGRSTSKWKPAGKYTSGSRHKPIRR